MDFKTSLDKYLTSSPDDGFDSWAESVCEYISDNFFEENEEWILNSEQCNTWLNKLFGKEIEDSFASKIIERAYSLYIKSNN